MKDIRKMYRLTWSSGKYHEDFCEHCVDKAAKDDYIESSFEIKTGTCHICGYERDEEVIILEKAEIIENEIKELKRISKQLCSSKRDVEIESLILRRREDYDDLHSRLSDPLKIRKSLQFPIEIDRKTLLIILDEHSEKLRRRKNELMQKIAKSSV